ncbi:MAG TPA: hypothetical protein VD788_10205 [Candidatus Polarisedimenticolaceae bacterium]|nr:hypothetical protein [Candidatus Polarisedimenticolaceae bacterium]
MVNLDRLAVETGGRFTERTNDLQLAYARAQRDRACTYTLGFYVEADDESRSRSLSVRVKRPGMRAIAPQRYVFRSDDEKRESLLRAAWIAPEMFQTGVVRAHAYPLRPADKGAWEALLAVGFTVPLGDSAGAAVRRRFGAMLYQGSRVVHRFSRTVTLQPDHSGVDSTPVVTFLERVRLPPGSYSLTAVVSDPLDTRPHAVKVPIAVEPIPRRELFLSPPILGRRSGPNLVVIGGGSGGDDQLGSSASFEPMLVQQVDATVDAVAVSQACMLGSPKHALEKKTRILRTLHRADGGAVGRLDPLPLTLDGEDKIRCQNLVDVIPTASIVDGEYVFHVELAAGADDASSGRRVRFVVSD